MSLIHLCKLLFHAVAILWRRTVVVCVSGYCGPAEIEWPFPKRWYTYVAGRGPPSLVLRLKIIGYLLVTSY